jgi:hypothetical protein
MKNVYLKIYIYFVKTFFVILYSSLSQIFTRCRYKPIAANLSNHSHQATHTEQGTAFSFR